LANFDSNGASADAPIHTNTKILVSEFVQTEPVSDNDADLASPDEYDYSKILADDLAMEDFVLDDDDVPEEEYVIPVVSLTADEAVQVNDFDVDIAIVDDGAVGEENDLDGVQSSAQEEGSEEANAVVVPELEVASGDDEYYEDYEEDLDIVHDDDDYEFLEHDDDENFATPQLKEIFDTVMAHSVVIYGKSDCPYTQRAKQIFAKYAITPHVVEVDTLANPAEIQDALTSLTLRATLPNIFVDGATIGGTDKLAELDARGDLNGVLRNAGLFAREKGESEVEL
jgi:glutaredoxin